jgi:hypothetical protein
LPILHLARDRRVAASSHNVHVCALRFLYVSALEKPDVVAALPRRKQAARVPVLASPPQIASLLGGVASITVRVILVLAYGAGLRVSEACGVRVDVPAGRFGAGAAFQHRPLRRRSGRPRQASPAHRAQAAGRGRRNRAGDDGRGRGAAARPIALPAVGGASEANVLGGRCGV